MTYELYLSKAVVKNTTPKNIQNTKKKKAVRNVEQKKIMRLKQEEWEEEQKTKKHNANKCISWLKNEW